MRHIATYFTSDPVFPMAANQNESLKRPRGENPFKGGKRNSAFWAILTTLDPECACSVRRKRKEDAEEFIASSSHPPHWRATLHAKSLKTVMATRPFAGWLRWQLNFISSAILCFFCSSCLRRDILYYGPNSSHNLAGLRNSMIGKQTESVSKVFLENW